MKKRPLFMLDTNLCIYIQRNKSPSVLERFKSLKPGQAVISIITWGELLYGAAKSQRAEEVSGVLERFSRLVPVLPMTADCGKFYGQIRADMETAGTPIGNNDLWIAAHALTSNLTLVTNNSKEFERIPLLAIENWI